jgi:ABC-type multidrug transport system fused ATPase/permease subunit
VTFWSDFLTLVFLNVLETLLTLLGPLLIKQLIDFVKTGKNAWRITWDPFWFSLETEYGLLLVGILVMSQGFTYLVSEHITYHQNMIGTLTSCALVGLIYEKTLKISQATNKRFKSGDLLTFIQVDVNKLSFLCY